jgi:ribosome-associated protein
MQEPERPSKTQRKREMEALQQIGVELVQLNADQLAQIELPEILLEAVREGQRIRDFEGRRRQMQYIGRLMREVDPDPIRARLAQWSGVAGEQTALQHRAERWRRRLLDEEGALASFAIEYPRSDLQHLRSLVASVERDKASGRPPRNYRELFRVVRDIVAKSSAAARAPDKE